MSARRAVFLDRDGVLNVSPVVGGVPRPPSSVEEVELLPGVREACERLAAAGWILIVVTNQPDIARGTTTREQVEAIGDRITGDLPITEVVICPHDDADGCRCRKPRPGMLLEAAARHGIDLGASVMVGDRWRDVAAGRAAGVRTCFVDRGYDERRPELPDMVVSELSEAADLILAESALGSGPGVDDWESHWTTYADAVEENPAQAYRRELIVAAIRSATGTPRRIVDVGSGQGDLLAELAREWPDAELVGLELTAEGIRRSRQKVPGATFWQVDLVSEELPEEVRGRADVVVCSEVLEHVDDPVPLARAASGCLTATGVLVVTVPGGPRTAFDRHIGHRRHFRPRALRDTLTAAGLEVEVAGGTGFPFFDLYKLVVLVRGRSVISDVASSSPPSRLAAGVMGLFARVLTLRTTSQHIGWQLRAVARRPRRTEDEPELTPS